ncbi:MAG: amidohydrolase family protein, partial [Bryobacterales bacterium]|nr:amidohydrolase family protein [Bryobacterales bacterium]
GKVVAAGPASAVKTPAGLPTVDLKGKTIIPGLIATHVHISDVDGLKLPAYTEANTQRQLALFARYGITTLWSLGGEKAAAFQARDSQNTPALKRSRLYLSGDVIVGKTPAEARAMVADMAGKKVDIIKIRVDDQLKTATKMTPDVYKAVIDEAHKRGLPVAAHIFYLEDAKGLLKAGVDFIAHSVRDQEVDAEFLQLMKQRNIPYSPTLTREISTFIYESTPKWFSDPFFTREADPAVVAQLQEPKRQQAMAQNAAAKAYKAALPTAMRNLKKVSDAGIRVIMGTDSGATANRFEGYFEHLEMDMMADAGMTPLQILRSATGEAAAGMKMKGVGTLTPGNWADFLVLDRNPLTDIRNTKSLSKVYIAGNPVPVQ